MDISFFPMTCAGRRAAWRSDGKKQKVYSTIIKNERMNFDERYFYGAGEPDPAGNTVYY